MSEKKHYNDEWDYEILENGYKLYSKSGCILKQVDQFSKIFVPDGSYEDNAIKQLDGIVNPPEPVDPSTSNDVLRADLDYVALMNDLILPSQEEEGE